MTLRTFNLRGADEATLIATLLAQGLLLGGENGWRAAPGVTISTNGRVALQSDSTLTPMLGHFALIAIDDAVFAGGQVGADAAYALRYTGQPVMYLLGVGDVAPDAVARALSYARARKRRGGFQRAGAAHAAKWYAFRDDDDQSVGSTLTTLAGLATDADVLAEDYRLVRLDQVDPDRVNTKAEAQALADGFARFSRQWAKSMRMLRDAVKTDPAKDWLTHSYPAGYQV